MKKENISKIIFIVLIIILIASIVCVLITGKKDKVLSMYDKINESSKYTFSIEEKNLEYSYIFTISKLDNNMNIDVKSDNDYTSTLTKDGHAYYIIHANKEYYTYDSDDIDSDILKNGFSEIENKKYKTGKENIEGKSYYYEEYEDVSTFVMLLSYNEEETETLKTRFYFDKDNIVYIKNILGDTEELLKIELKQDVDENVFNIPEGYTEIG